MGGAKGRGAKGEVDLLRWVVGDPEKEEVGRQRQKGVVQRPWGGGWGRIEKQR